jgi:hypothetical protein
MDARGRERLVPRSGGHYVVELYNEVHPHKALGYRSPREFIAAPEARDRVRSFGGYNRLFPGSQQSGGRRLLVRQIKSSGAAGGTCSMTTEDI